MMAKIFGQNPRLRYRLDFNQLLRPDGYRLGRNDPCPCGSGQKYKNCCMGKVVVASVVGRVAFPLRCKR
jgi:hypothetical protein